MLKNIKSTIIWISGIALYVLFISQLSGSMWTNIGIAALWGAVVGVADTAVNDGLIVETDEESDSESPLNQGDKNT